MFLKELFINLVIILIFMCCVLLSMDHVLYRVYHLSVDQHDYKIYLTIIKKIEKSYVYTPTYRVLLSSTYLSVLKLM